MRAFLFLLIVMCLPAFFPPVSQSATLSAALEDALSSAHPSGSAHSSTSILNVIVCFEDQVDFAMLGKQGSRREKLELLERKSMASRKPFLNRFKDQLWRERPFWIINGLALSTRAATIESMKSFDGVRAIYLDEEISLPPTIESSRRPKGEWTYGLEILSIPQLRKKYALYGEGVTVGVIDTGVDPSHPDLSGKVLAFKDFVEGEEDAYDDQGHGTHCCGTIAGGNAGGTHIGVAPKAKLIVAKAFSSTGSTQTSWLLAAMEYMADPDGDPSTDDAPQIVSNSWGGSPSSTVYLEATQNWLALGIFPSFAAGNSGPGSGTVGTPGAYPEAFAVGATNSSDDIAYFSSRGPVTWDGVEYVKPDVSAPGQGIYSAKPGGGYTSMSGTSMACPHVSGLVALILQAKPNMVVSAIKRLLEENSLDLGNTGKDNVFGSGRVNALASMDIAISGGRILGRLLDAESGEPVAGEISIAEKQITLHSNSEDGSFSATLPAGVYTLNAAAFSYEDSKTFSVDLDAGEDTSLEIELDRAPRGTLSALVKASDTAAGVESRIRVLGTPLEPFSSSDGSFDISLPEGRYDLLVTAFAYANYETPSPLRVKAGETTEVSIDLQPLPPYLIVDDDNGRSYEDYFEAAFTSLGLEYDSISLADSGPLDALDILGYELILWFTGDDYQSTLTPKDRDILEEYLKSGGRLLLSGQDIGYDIKNSSFYEDSLKAVFEKDDSKQDEVRGQGLSFSIDGGAGNQKYPDVVSPRPAASVFFEYADGGSAALLIDSTPGKVLYLAFGFEGIAGNLQRKKVMDACLSSLGPSRLDNVSRLALFDEERLRSQWSMIVAEQVDGLSAKELEVLELRLTGRRKSPAVRDLIRVLRMKKLRN